MLRKLRLRQKNGFLILKKLTYFEKTSQFMEKDVTEPSKSKAFNTYYHDKVKVDFF